MSGAGSPRLAGVAGRRGRAAEWPGGCFFPSPAGPPLPALAVLASGGPGAGSGRGPSAPEAIAAGGRGSGPSRTCCPGSTPRQLGSAPGCSRRPLSAGGEQPAAALALSLRQRNAACPRLTWPSVPEVLVHGSGLPPGLRAGSVREPVLGVGTKPCQSYSLVI